MPKEPNTNDFIRVKQGLFVNRRYIIHLNLSDNPTFEDTAILRWDDLLGGTEVHLNLYEYDDLKRILTSNPI